MVVCFGGKAVLLNPHKRKKGRSTLGQAEGPLFDFANEVLRVLSQRMPETIMEQVIRVDFFQHPDTGKYYLNEIEGLLCFV